MIMALYGTFDTFPLPDLLQWVETAGKTGVLELEHRLRTRNILFRNGRVIGCSSADPPSLLGQVLLARGEITETQLSEALATQEREGGMVGSILVEMGAVDNEAVIRHVAAKAEETIYGLFDWDDATFQFVEDAPFPVHLIEVDLRIQDILLKGMQRLDEMTRFRDVLHDPGIILSRTDAPLPAEIETSKASMRILLSINGERTLAEVLLHARGSEYLVTKFLYELHRKRLIEITGLRQLEQVQADTTTAENHDRHDPDLAGELYVASSLMARNELDAALAVLRAAARAFPGAPSVRQMIGRAETMYQERAGEELPPEKIPVVVKEEDYLRDLALSPGEAFLLTLIDGASDIKSILWIAPMRAVEILQTIKLLLDKGIITLR